MAYNTTSPDICEAYIYPHNSLSESPKPLCVGSLEECREAVKRKFNVKQLSPLRKWDGNHGDVEAYRANIDEEKSGGVAIRKVQLI